MIWSYEGNNTKGIILSDLDGTKRTKLTTQYSSKSIAIDGPASIVYFVDREKGNIYKLFLVQNTVILVFMLLNLYIKLFILIIPD